MDFQIGEHVTWVENKILQIGIVLLVEDNNIVVQCKRSKKEVSLKRDKLKLDI